MKPYLETQMMNPFFMICAFALAIGFSYGLWLYIRIRFSVKTTAIIATIYALMFLLPLIAMLTQHLTTSVNDEGISFRYFSGIQAKRIFSWKDIYYINIIHFKPYYQSAGRASAANPIHDNEYAISGDIGLQVVLKDGTRYIIGTQNPTELNIRLHEMAAPYVITEEQYSRYNY